METTKAEADSAARGRRYRFLGRLAEHFGWLSLALAGLGYLLVTLDDDSSDLWWAVGVAGLLGVVLVGAGIWFSATGAGNDEQPGTN